MSENLQKEGLGPETRLRELLDITCEVSRLRNLDELLVYLAEHAARLIEADRSTIFLANTTEGHLMSRVALGEKEVLEIATDQGIAGHVFRTCTPVILHEAYEDTRFHPEIDQQTGYTTRNLICVPIRYRDRPPLGVFQVLNKLEGSFTDEDLLLLTALGGHAAVGLESARAWQEREAAVAGLMGAKRELTDRVRQLDLVYELELAVTREVDIDSFMKAVIQRIVRALDAESGSILLAGETGGPLYFHVATGPGSSSLDRFRLRENEGIASWVHQRGEPVICNDPYADNRFSPRVSEMLHSPMRNILCVPLGTEGRRIGALEFCNRRIGPFTFEDMRVAELVARSVGVVLARKLDAVERQKRDRMATIGLLAGSIAHDLRGPLANLLTYANVLRTNREPEREAVDSFLDTLNRQVRKCLAMTEDILDYTQGTLQYAFEDVSVEDLLAEVRETIGHEVKARRIELTLDPGEGGTVRVDRDRVTRVFVNLALNALRALGSRGRLDIRAQQNPGSIDFLFEDDGPGVPQEIRERLFEPFVSGEKSTGLGLSIARQIIEDGHGGAISLDGSYDGGARFVVTLPKTREE